MKESRSFQLRWLSRFGTSFTVPEAMWEGLKLALLLWALRYLKLIPVGDAR